MENSSAGSPANNVMTEERRSSLRVLEEQLGYCFQDPSLMDNALTHRSYVNENPLLAIQDNERMEFLGDAVLELCVSDMLMKEFASHTEGQLSKLRASVVNERPLAELARRFRLGDYLLLGKGEETSGGREKNSLLANTFEALMAAVYLDGGFDRALLIVNRFFASLIAEGTEGLIYRDYKTALQELSRNRFKEMPQYTLVGEDGPDHNKIFVITMTIPGVIETSGTGRNKKEAEQQAAKKALEELRSQDLPAEEFVCGA